MYKQFLLTILCSYFVSSSVFADQPMESCPDITIVTLNPLTIKVNVANSKTWSVTTHEIDRAAINTRVLIMEDMPNVSVIDEAAADTASLETPELQDVIPYEYHVLTDQVRNVNKAETIPLETCQYGLWWKKYHKKLFYKEKQNAAVRTLKAVPCKVPLIGSYMCMDKYYYIYYSLIELKPTYQFPITISVSSIINNNDTGWTKNKYGTGFDCFHDRLSDAKCTWISIPNPASNIAPGSFTPYNQN